MPNPTRPLAFILAASDHGAMIVNRFDQHLVGEQAFGVGFQLLSKASYDSDEVATLLKLLDLRRKHYGDGVVAVDCGANLGVHTVEWAKHMTGWGVVLAFEAQERIYYALAGNLAINNCFNARAIHAAVSRQSGSMKIPQPNYLTFSSFGSIELTRRERGEFVGQPIDYSEDKMAEVRMVHLDSFNFPRLDLLKIDVEGMELEVLAGAAKCIAEKRPIVIVELLKTDAMALRGWLEDRGYSVFPSGLNFIAIHQDDACNASITVQTPAPAPA
ncbi:MAG: FkbM family methyltransferase [Xanthobacteraceae bacterium]